MASTHSGGLPMLPIYPPTVEVVELFDDRGTPIYAIKVRAQGAELTVGRRRDRAKAECDAAMLRDVTPWIDN